MRKDMKYKTVTLKKATKNITFKTSSLNLNLTQNLGILIYGTLLFHFRLKVKNFSYDYFVQ